MTDRVGKYDKKCREFLDKYWGDNHFSPSFREIGEACGIGSTNTVSNVVDRVARMYGYVKVERQGRVVSITPKWVADAINLAKGKVSNVKDNA